MHSHSHFSTLNMPLMQPFVGMGHTYPYTKAVLPTMIEEAQKRLRRDDFMVVIRVYALVLSTIWHLIIFYNTLTIRHQIIGGKGG